VKKLLGISLCLLATGLAACKDRSDTVSISPQHWNEMVVRIETHPNPPLPGMSEIVVIVTGPHGRPSGNLIVSLRGNDSNPWIQAIQDGFIGVYRRAVDIGDNSPASVQVRIQNGDEQKVLLFPIKLASD
jgi:hypothetical protein